MMHKVTQPPRRRFARDLDMLADRMFGNGGRGMAYKQLGEKYGLHPESVRKTLARDDVRAVQQVWQERMREAHRAMGHDALEATQALIRQRDPRTVSDYWKRMGVSRKPSVDVEVEEIHIDAPPEFLAAIKAVAVGPRNEARQEPADEIACPVHGCADRFPDTRVLYDHLKAVHASPQPTHPAAGSVPSQYPRLTR